jgi:hypothetical protein
MEAKFVYGTMEIDHLTPKNAGGTDDEENLWVACSHCNTFKGAKVDALDALTGEQAPLFNPRLQNWHEHFRLAADGGEIVGLTPCGRATVVALAVNDSILVQIRQRLFKRGEYPPAE